MGILEDLISMDDSIVRLISLHRGPCCIVLVAMDLAKGRMAGIDMGWVVEHGRSQSALAAPTGSIKESWL